MKFNCIATDLARGLEIVSSAVPSRSSLPILGHVLLVAEGSSLKITATDLDFGIVTRFEAEVHEEGEVAVPFDVLNNLVRGLGSSAIEVDVDGTKLGLRSAYPKTVSKISGSAAQDFPSVSVEGARSLFAISGGDLVLITSQVTVVSAKDETRPVLTGTLLRRSGDNLVVAGTDGFRLAELRLSTDKQEDFSLIIPSRVLSTISRKSAKEETVKVELMGNENQVIFHAGETSYAARLLEGDFPDYQKIVPAVQNTRVTASMYELLNAVQISSVFAQATGGVVKLSLNPDKLLKVSANLDEVGSNVTQIEANVTGQPIDIAFSSAYLMDALSSVTSTNIILETEGDLKPVVFKPVPEDGTQSNYFHIVMPIKAADKDNG